MFNKIFLLSIFLVLIIGCSFTDNVNEDTSVPETPVPTEDSEPFSLNKGDKVLALWSGKTFYEGEITDISGDISEMTIKWADGTSPKAVESLNVFPLPKDNAKLKVEIGVSDDFVDLAVKTVMDSARTGNVGDGKIFVEEIERVIRIRTGEENDQAI